MSTVTREKPDTLKGKLQRGHGAGYLEALQNPPEELAPILIDCICNDGRLDQQVESRYEYYASLIVDTHIEISPIADFLKANDDIDDQSDRLLTIYTLGNLALRGLDKAAVFLREYVSYGYNWCAAISELMEANSNLSGLDTIICNRYENDKELLKDIDKQSLDASFFDFLRGTNPRLQKLLEAEEVKDWIPKRENPKKRFKPNFTALTVEELFDHCDRHNLYKLGRILKSKLSAKHSSFLENMVQSGHDYQRALALNCMGMLGTTESFAYLKNFFEDVSNGLLDNPKYEKRFICAQALRNIACAPPEASLETGRKWFMSPNYPENVAGWHILERYATIEDAPMLKQTIIESLQDEDTSAYMLCSAVDALGNFENIGMIPEIEKVYHEAIYSYARRRAVKTMSINDPLEFASKYAYECLYDCEDDTKLLGIEFANISDPAVYQRLSELAEDPLEDEQVRQDAKERLFL